MNASTQKGRHFTGRWIWTGLVLTACGGLATAATDKDGASDARDEGAMDAHGGDAPGGSAVGICSGPYPLDADIACYSKRALVECSGEGGEICLNDSLECGDLDGSPKPDPDCVNLCAPSEYAVWCALLDGSVYPEGGGPFEMIDGESYELKKGCRMPGGVDQSSAVYLCCTCPN